MGQYVDSRTQWRRQQWRWRRDPHAPPLLLLCLCVAHDFCTVTATPLDARAVMMARRTASTDQDTPTEYDAAVLRKELVQMGASDDTHPLGDCAHWVCFDELKKKYACQDTCNLACRETTLDDHVTPKCHAASGGGRLQEALADVGPPSDSSHALSLQASGGSSSSSFLTPLSSGRSAFTKDSSSRPASSSMDSSQKDFYSKYFQSKPFAVDPEVSPEVYYKRDSPDGQAYLDGDMRYAPVDAMVSKKDVAADNRGHEALPVWGKFWSKGGVDEDHIALSDAERAENMYTRNSLGALLWDEERQGHRRIKVEMAPLILSKVDSSVDTSRDSLHKKGGSFADRGSGGSLHMEQKSLDRQLLLYGESSRLSSFSKATQADAPVPPSTMESSILSSLEPGSLSSQGSSVSATYQMIILTAAAPMFCVAVMPGCNTAFSGINVMGLLTPFLALLQSFPTTKYISEYILAGLDSYENSQKKCDGLDSYQPTKDFTCVAAMAPEGCGLDASTDWATLPVNYATVNLEECSALACNNNYTGFVFRTWANSICEASDCSNHAACAYSNCSGNMTCSESTWSGGCLLLKNNKCTGNEYDGSILQPKEGSAVYYKTDREDVSSLMQYCILVVIVHVLLRYLVVGNLGTGLYTEDPIETTDEVHSRPPQARIPHLAIPTPQPHPPTTNTTTPAAAAPPLPPPLTVMYALYPSPLSSPHPSCPRPARVLPLSCPRPAPVLPPAPARTHVQLWPQTRHFLLPHACPTCTAWLRLLLTSLLRHTLLPARARARTRTFTRTSPLARAALMDLATRPSWALRGRALNTVPFQ